MRQVREEIRTKTAFAQTSKNSPWGRKDYACDKCEKKFVHKQHLIYHQRTVHEGQTPLHDIIFYQRYRDEDCAMALFEICDEQHRFVKFDARDKKGRTPLELAVTNMLPNTMSVLLNNGADLSSFVFSTASDVDEELQYEEFDFNFQYDLASGAMACVEQLEKRGYELKRRDALTIMTLFKNNRLFEKPKDNVKRWYDRKSFAMEAKKLSMKPTLSLYGFVRLKPEEAAKLMTCQDHYELAKSCKLWWNLSEKDGNACCMNLCEKVSRKFFRRWALEHFMELTRYRLPILCSEMIIKQLNDCDDVVQKFFDHGVDPNCLEQFGTNDSPLHVALIYCSERVFKLLLRSGANPNVANAKGSTPLHQICQSKYCNNYATSLFDISHERYHPIQVGGADESGKTPLHYALTAGFEEIIESLLRRGADPNAADAEGSTPLHIICQRDKFASEVDECHDLSKKFFEINDDTHQMLRIDSKDNLGRTPLQLAVAHLLPDEVDVLLNRGADLSNFAFPTESYFSVEADKILKWFKGRDISLNYKLSIASGGLGVVRQLEKRGYELKRNEALSIMLFDKYGLFDKSENFDEYLFDDEDFLIKAKRITISSNLSLYDLIWLGPKEMSKILTTEDYFKFWRSSDLWEVSKGPTSDACTVHLSEKISRGFFRRWAVDALLDLTRYKLPILCFEMIIEQLKNEDLWHITLAAADQKFTRKIQLGDRRGATRVSSTALHLHRQLEWRQISRSSSNFSQEEIEWLLTEDVKNAKDPDFEVPIIDFVIQIGYKDEPIVDEDGKPLLRRTTPLHHAFRRQDWSSDDVFVQLFKIYDRFDVNYIDEDGFTHFHVACEYGNEDPVEKFLQLGQDPNCLAQASVDPPLHLAVNGNFDEKVELLLRHGADPNISNQDGLTPLHILSMGYGDYITLTEMLFGLSNAKYQPIKIDPKDKLGRTPLKLAMANFNTYMVRFLLDHGADLSEFYFPDESDFDEACQLWADQNVAIASFFLAIFKSLEKGGYQWDLSDVLTILTLFVKYGLFEKVADIENYWYDDEEFTTEAKENTENPALSLFEHYLKKRKI
ncbi:unnamed protein product [Trichogramma brassicae]|uniref:C2H2-type domain-containing protein n=1 Tax=Trichogramma brassicae TaxID=86971 RepID=A0A6H5J1B1_9HYME|nr:unnamed protein product [Trichogramma brassicae]